MELDETLKQKILALDNDALERSVLAVARQMGVDEKKARSRMGDPEKVKRALEGLKQKDLDRIAARLGEEKSAELMQAVKREMKDG